MAGNDVVEVAFIGGGLSSAVGMTHFSATSMDGRMKLVAGVFSRNEETNARTAALWHVPPERTYADYRQLINAEAGRVGAVCVLTPSPDHVTQVCDLLDAGIPVICEKPLALDLAGIAHIRQHYDPARHYLAVTFNYTGNVMLRELKARMERGDFGRIHQIMVEMPQDAFARPPDIAGLNKGIQSWRLTDGVVPMICLDLGIHMHSMISFLTGEEAGEVMGQFAYTDGYPVVSSVQALGRYPSGMAAHFWFSKAAIGHKNGLRIRVYGDKGSAEWYQMEPETIHVAFKTGERMIIDRAANGLVSNLFRYNRMKPGHPAGYIEAFANYYYDIVDGLRAGPEAPRNPYVFGIDDAENGLALFEAVARSHRSGQWEKVVKW